MSVLRRKRRGIYPGEIETTTNNVSEFKRFREVRGQDGSITEKIAPLKKNIYSLFPLSSLLKASNRRYLEFISQFDDPGQGIRHLGKVTKTVEYADHSYRGFNFYNTEDQKLFTTLIRGEFNINGFQNKSLRVYLPEIKQQCGLTNLAKAQSTRPY